jgi:hypothetical protein
VKLSEKSFCPTWTKIPPRSASVGSSLPAHLADRQATCVVERADIARRAEGIAPIHVLQVGSPLTKVFRSTRPTGDEKGSAKKTNVKVLLKLFSSWGRVEFQRCDRWREQNCLRGHCNAMGPPLCGSRTTQPRRGATDRGQHRQAAGVAG